MEAHTCAYAAMLKWALGVIALLFSAVSAMWYAQRADGAAQRAVDTEQTAALSDLAKQSERVEAILQTALGLLSKPTTANPGGASVEG
jgi:NADH:ubiquinone oxidoreductase subunit 2 (subunit N)